MYTILLQPVFSRARSISLCLSLRTEEERSSKLLSQRSTTTAEAKGNNNNYDKKKKWHRDIEGLKCGEGWIHRVNVKDRDTERCWDCVSLVGRVRKTFPEDECLPQMCFHTFEKDEFQ